MHNNWGDLSMTIDGIVTSILLVGASIKLLNIVINNKKVMCACVLCKSHVRFLYLMTNIKKHILDDL